MVFECNQPIHHIEISLLHIYVLCSFLSLVDDFSHTPQRYNPFAVLTLKHSKQLVFGLLSCYWTLLLYSPSAFLLFRSVVSRRSSLHSNELYRDPTLLFFNPCWAYAPAYSTTWQQEAEAFALASTNTSANSARKPSNDFPNDNKTLRVGIASVARNGARHFQIQSDHFWRGWTPWREKIFTFNLS